MVSEDLSSGAANGVIPGQSWKMRWDILASRVRQEIGWIPSFSAFSSVQALHRLDELHHAGEGSGALLSAQIQMLVTSGHSFTHQAPPDMFNLGTV